MFTLPNGTACQYVEICWRQHRLPYFLAFTLVYILNACWILHACRSVWDKFIENFVYLLSNWALLRATFFIRMSTRLRKHHSTRTRKHFSRLLNTQIACHWHNDRKTYSLEMELQSTEIALPLVFLRLRFVNGCLPIILHTYTQNWKRYRKTNGNAPDVLIFSRKKGKLFTCLHSLHAEIALGPFYSMTVESFCNEHVIFTQNRWFDSCDTLLRFNNAHMKNSNQISKAIKIEIALELFGIFGAWNVPTSTGDNVIFLPPSIVFFSGWLRLSVACFLWFLFHAHVKIYPQWCGICIRNSEIICDCQLYCVWIYVQFANCNTKCAFGNVRNSKGNANNQVVSNLKGDNWKTMTAFYCLAWIYWVFWQFFNISIYFHRKLFHEPYFQLTFHVSGIRSLFHPIIARLPL